MPYVRVCCVVASSQHSHRDFLSSLLSQTDTDGRLCGGRRGAQFSVMPGTLAVYLLIAVGTQPYALWCA